MNTFIPALARLRNYLQNGASSEVASSAILHSAILDSVTDGIYGLDCHGKTTFVNAAATRLTGWSDEELIGKCQHAYLHHTKADGSAHRVEDCPIYAVCGHGNVHHQEEDLFWRKDGASFPVSYTVTPLRKCGAVIGSVVVFQDISERKQKEREEKDRQVALELLVRDRTQELRRINSQLSSVLDAAALVSVMACDTSGTITLFNRGAEAMLGYQASEVVGKATPLIFHLPNEIEAWGQELKTRSGASVPDLSFVAAATTIQGSDVREWTYVRKDGAYLPVSLAVTKIVDEAGTLTGFLGVAFDISQRILSEQTLEAAKGAAESANIAKGEFLATMSHEIRTPMNAILGLSDLLLTGTLDPGQRKRVLTLRHSAEALLSILNGVLEVSKIDANKIELEMADFDLRALAEDVADLMAIKAQEKGLEFLCFIEPAVATQLRGDANRIRQMLMNLVANAVKFTHRGEVSVRVRQGEGEQAGLIRFDVADTGIGVPPEKQSLLFQRFSQAEASTARQYGGTGLGLSIVRGLAEAMGGTAGFDSKEGSGSTFWFAAPLATQSNIQRPRPLSLAGKRILCVDDNQASRSLLRDLLMFWQCAVEEASDAQLALNRLNDQSQPTFDAIIIDVDMPTFDGDRLGASIRSESRLADAPIILLTPISRTLAPGKWETSGSVGRVTKPIKQSELEACLASALAQPSVTRASDRRAEKPVVRGREDRAKYRLLLVEDNLINQEVALGILQHMGYRADVAADGEIALRALKSFEYTLVLTDCQMPNMDGYELTRMVRNPSIDVLNHSIPIIAVTAHSLQGDREKCTAAGMDDYVSKPLRAETLDEVLTRWIKVAGSSTPAAKKTAKQENTVQFDTDDLIERLMGNEGLAKRVAGAFVDSMPQQLAALAEAINRFDGQATRLAAHSIKGAAANVGTAGIQGLASKLENLGEAGALSEASEIFPELAASFESVKPLLQQFCGKE